MAQTEINESQDAIRLACRLAEQVNWSTVFHPEDGEMLYVAVTCLKPEYALSRSMRWQYRREEDRDLFLLQARIETVLYMTGIDMRMPVGSATVARRESVKRIERELSFEEAVRSNGVGSTFECVLHVLSDSGYEHARR